MHVSLRLEVCIVFICMTCRCFMRGKNCDVFGGVKRHLKSLEVNIRKPLVHFILGQDVYFWKWATVRVYCTKY